jgi:DeoR family fructose operon transcriptional repressor
MSVGSSLATEERLSWIAAELESTGTVRISAAAAEFGVSEMTIRRDLLELEGLGLARRVRGGAVAVGPVPFEGRTQVKARAKAKIAAKLRPLVPATGAIGMDASSTVLRLAGILDRARDLIIMTNSIETFAALKGKPGLRPMLTGGEQELHSGSLIGPMACRTAASLMLTRVFLSASAVDATAGASESTIVDAEVKIAMASVAAHIVVAADASKLDSRALAPTVPWARVDALVTELEPDDPRLDAYRDQVELL